MTDFVVWYLAAFGVAYIVGFSKISFPFRVMLGDYKGTGHVHVQWFLDLIECPACLCWWLGIFYGAWKGIGLPVQHIALTAALYGASTCATGFLLGRVSGLIESDKKYE